VPGDEALEPPASTLTARGRRFAERVDYETGEMTGTRSRTDFAGQQLAPARAAHPLTTSWASAVTAGVAWPRCKPAGRARGGAGGEHAVESPTRSVPRRIVAGDQRLHARQREAARPPPLLVLYEDLVDPEDSALRRCTASTRGG
jgi:hypothetical protein